VCHARRRPAFAVVIMCAYVRQPNGPHTRRIDTGGRVSVRDTVIRAQTGTGGPVCVLSCVNVCPVLIRSGGGMAACLCANSLEHKKAARLCKLGPRVILCERALDFYARRPCRCIVRV
jgi:hypothetical protein